MARSAAQKTPKVPSIARQLGTHPQLRRLMWALNRLRNGQPLKATDLAAEFEVNVSLGGHLKPATEGHLKTGHHE